MTEPPKRRWFQFSLLTLLIVTVLAVALGFVFHRINRARQRQAFITSHTSTAVIGYAYHGRDGGDEVVVDVFLVPWATDDELETARRLFPEATVVRLK
jgi:hypothetical protein